MPTLVQGFNEWMVQRRGLKQGTLRGYGGAIRDLIETLGDAPDEYTAHSLRAFVLKRVSGASRAQALLVTTAMRNFLRYLVAQGRCRPGLEGAVPTIAMWRQAALPRYLPGADVNLIIDACERSTPVGLRDRAALLLLARLGLRAGDIVALRMGDVDWREASVRVTGKSRTEIKLPITQEVGDALLEYVNMGRPPAETEHVFVRMLAPWRSLAVSSISALVSRAMSRARVDFPCRGAHVLRHSAATEMLRQGATLDQIGAVLRHQYLDTTGIYAKVDVNRLTEITLPWPGVQP
jgi:site-specific recombinase XerD